MFVKRSKNQLRDYMTTGPAHTEAARLTGPAPGSCNQALTHGCDKEQTKWILVLAVFERVPVSYFDVAGLFVLYAWEQDFGVS